MFLWETECRLSGKHQDALKQTNSDCAVRPYPALTSLALLGRSLSSLCDFIIASGDVFHSFPSSTHTPLPSTNTQSKHFALLIRVWLLLRKQEHKGAGIMTASVNMNPWHSRPFSDKRLNRSLMRWAAPKLRRSGQQCVMNSLSQYFNACLCVHGRTARVWADPHHSRNVDHSVSQINYS